MGNKDKIILDLCGGTGAWSKPYKDAGYTVYNITLPEYDILRYAKGDTDIGFINSVKYSWLWLYKENIYGILAAPPCTMFSFARTTAKKPRCFKSGMETVKACLDIIWECRYNVDLKFWALENPVGYLRQFLGKPYLTFNPTMYGDYYNKRTDLWGFFNKPKKSKVKLNAKQKSLCYSNSRKLPEGETLSGRRAITPAGFAKAFYEANK